MPEESLNQSCALEEGFEQNTGVLIPEHISENDFRSGGISGIEFKVVEPSGTWYQYRSKDEPQHGVYFDTFACVTFSAINVVEMQVNRMVDMGKMSKEAFQALNDLGFFDENNRFRCSNRFTAKMSGTTKRGNYLTAVWDSIRKDGLLPYKDWDFPYEQRNPVFDWDDYYAEIPQELKDKAKKSLIYLSTMYEWVITNGGQMSEGEHSVIELHLKQAPLQVAAAICRGWNDGDKIPVPNCGNTDTSHATAVSGLDEVGNFYDVDHYRPFLKKLDKNYPLPYILKGIVELRDTPLPQEENKPKFIYKFDYKRDGQVQLGQRGEIVKQIQTALFVLGFLKPELITGFYWQATREAVYQFQKKYNVCTPAELEGWRGKYFGKKSMEAMNMEAMNQIFNNL